MELGPIQKKWLESLRAHPDRQGYGSLGMCKGGPGDYEACCLGELLITYRLENGESLEDVWGITEGAVSDVTVLFDSDTSSGYLYRSYQTLGLNNEKGAFAKDGQEASINYQGEEFESLSDMNDCYVSWPEIAKVVEANADLVFTKSL